MSKTSPINVKEFSLHSGKWNTYISQLTAWFDINDVKPDARTKYLIAVVGSETLDLIIDLCYPSEPHEVSYDDIVSKVREHLSPKRSELAERMCFRACKQTSEQSITEYVARLKQLAQKCNFTGTAYLEENLRDQLAYGIRSEAIRFKLLTETKLTFSRAVEIATSLEAADRDSKASGPGGGAGATSSTAMSVKEEGVHAMRAGGGGGARAPSRRRNSTAAASRERCPRCLGPHHPRRCSFINTECYVCGKKGHIAKACKKRKTHSVNVCSESMDPGSENEPEEDDEYDVPLYMVGGDDSDEPWWRTVKVNGVNMRMQLDSGSANSPNQEPVYRKVAIVENFFDIIYTVHVELEGRPGKHAGQKRTYRTITETYAFLPREAVTRFLTGCAECARRPRSASPPPLPTPSPSPTRHPTYLPFLPHCPTDYTRNWESEIDAAHNYPYEPKFDYTELQPIKKVESPKVTDSEDQEPTYIELTSKKVNGFDSNALFSRCSPVEPAFREEEPVRTDPEIDKDDNSLIDVEDVKIDSPAPRVIQKIDTEENSEKETKAKENVRVKEEKTDDKKQKKYNPLDVANLTAKDPPKSASPPRKKLLPSSLEYSNSFGRFPKPWRPDGGVYFGGEEVDYSVPITTAYLKHMRSMAYQERVEMENKDNLTPEPADMNDDDNFSSQAFAKDAEKLKMMLLAWNYHSQTQGRNGDITEIGADSMADLWASYHSALGLGSKPPKPPTPLATGHSSPIHVGSATPVEPASTHDETSSSDRTKDDDDAGASDDDSDDRVDPHHHDPERLKAFNMFVRLFVDENLDRIVPISKQPKEKIQAIIDSCTRQFPEFAERARKRIRTYLKSCRRNKKVRGDGPATGNGGNNTGTANAWDTAVRPTPAHLTSVQAEHILAQACENESLNAKRMRLGLDPVSQPMPTVPTPMAIDTTATSAVASSFLSLYSGAINPSSAPATSTSNTASASAPAPAPAPAHSKAAADTTRPSVSPTLENPLLNNNSLKLDNANGNTGSKTASPSSSPAPLFRPSFPTTFGTPQTFGRQSSNTNPATALSSSALLSTLSALPPSGVGVNAAMAAYQSALLSAMAAHTHSFPTNLSAPTDLSLKSPAPAVHPAPTLGSGKLLSHKLSGAEVGAVRQLITGYRESAAFLLRSADELEALLLNQP